MNERNFHGVLSENNQWFSQDLLLTKLEVSNARDLVLFEYWGNVLLEVAVGRE